MSALSQAPVIGIFSHAGFQDAADGASHQSLSYFAKSFSLPYTQVYHLSSAEEAFYLLSGVVEEFYQERKKGLTPPSTLFFLGRETFPETLYSEGSAKKYPLTKAQVVFDHSKGKNPVLIVSSGPLLHQAFIAATELKAKGQGVVLINNPLVSDPDTETISYWLKICGGRLLTAEEHQLKGGFSSLLTLKLTQKGIKVLHFKALGVKSTFGRSGYQARELYELFGLDKNAIKKAVLELSG